MAQAQDIDWSVISLARTPERLAQFMEFNAALGIPLQVAAAVDGRDYDLRDIQAAGLAAPDLEHWTPGALGAALSHLQLWNTILETGRPCCIFEDDVVLRGDFVERTLEMLDRLPPEWDMAMLGFNTDTILDVSIAPGCDFRGGFTMLRPTPEDCARFQEGRGAVGPVRLNFAFGTCAYLVSPSGARKLIDGCYPLSRQEIAIPALGFTLLATTKDVLMNRLFRSINAFVCLPPIALPINDKTVSTISAEA